MKPTEAACVDAWMAQNPAFVGLVSVISNATNKDELETIILGLTARGQRILGTFDDHRVTKIS